MFVTSFHYEPHGDSTLNQNITQSSTKSVDNICISYDSQVPQVQIWSLFRFWDIGGM